MVVTTITADKGIALGGNILEVVDGIGRGVVVAIAYTPVAKVDFTGGCVIEFEPRVGVVMIIEQRLDVVGPQFVEH